MGTAYIYFGKPMTAETGAGLVEAIRALMGEREVPTGPLLWDRFHIDFATGGGDIIAAFGAYNTLKGVNAKITTHNAGAVDSAAIMTFMLGEKRTASPASAFFFHQVQWSFASSDNLTMTVINDATKWLSTYEEMMAEVVSQGTDLSKEDVLRMMREGTSVRPNEAKAMGLIHGIEDCSIPADARSQQV